MPRKQRGLTNTLQYQNLRIPMDFCQNKAISPIIIADWYKVKFFESQFLEHYINTGFLPTSKELDTHKYDLPTRYTIKRLTGLNLSQFYEKYFTEIQDDMKLKEVKKFRNEYIRLNCPTKHYYNKHKQKGCPTYRHVMKILNCDCFEQVIVVLNIPLINNTRPLNVMIEMEEKDISRENNRFLKKRNDEVQEMLIIKK